MPAAWYSVERGDVYIAVLNHTSDKDTFQQFTQWLVEDAAKSTCTWKVLVTHVPAYYNQSHRRRRNLCAVSARSLRCGRHRLLLLRQ